VNFVEIDSTVFKVKKIEANRRFGNLGQQKKEEGWSEERI
jgi:hypothetical protein